jgi:ornithine--oxo-acid transaminase
MPNKNSLIQLEKDYGSNNYNPLPVILSKGNGIYVWDTEGNQYFDYLSALSSVNQGHCHPKILDTFIKQASKLSMTSRAFYSDQLGPFEETICKLMNYEKVLLMNSGAEGVETALKIARKWGYEIKGVPDGQAKIITCSGNFHGRTISISSFSSDKGSKQNFGPLTPGFIEIPYNDTSALKEVLKKEPNVTGFLVEPIQGEAGVIIPDEGYLTEVKKLCEIHNVLFIGDEIQSGLGRSGELLASNYENIRPDILILAKSLSGGFMPVSAVLCDNPVMEVIKPGQHGSTFGGNPLAAAVSKTALEVIIEEKLPENSKKMGAIFREELSTYQKQSSIVSMVRGKGLFNAIVIKNDSPVEERNKLTLDICMKLKELGLLCKPTKGNIIRMTPPLIINETQLREGIDIIKKGLKTFE